MFTAFSGRKAAAERESFCRRTAPAVSFTFGETSLAPEWLLRAIREFCWGQNIAAPKFSFYWFKP